MRRRATAPARLARGFTLLELMIAGAIAGILSLAAFAAVTTMQQATATQSQATGVYSTGRIALEMMQRDIRQAGDSTMYLSEPCIGIANRSAAATVACPAILEAHPWRIIVARNGWVPPPAFGPIVGTSGSLAGSTPPLPTSPMHSRIDNIVAYEFVPLLAGGAQENLSVFNGVTGAQTPRTVIRGRIDRILNPFGYDPGSPTAVEGAVPAVRSVLVENVVLDDGMRCNPSDITVCDARYDHALFGYRVVARSGQLIGAAALVNRPTATGFFITPPINFYAPTEPGVLGLTAAPYVPRNPGARQIVGLTPDSAADAAAFYDDDPANPNHDNVTRQLLTVGVADPYNPEDPSSLIRAILDRNRIRAVRVAFKVYSGREDPQYRLGLDLNGRQAGSPPAVLNNGTSPIFMFEGEAEIKSVVWRTRATDI